jgi:uncharacterized protein (UPF0332 family)
MTDTDRKKDIAAEARRGEESLESASILLREKKLADAVSRAYYAAFHFARALLLSVGEEVRTHGGLERLLHRDFVRPGTLAPEIALLYSRLLKHRGDADYTAEFVFTATAAKEEVAAAGKFVDAARVLLRKGGWL